MILVKTQIKQSDIHGIGVFADEFIPVGTKVWEFTEGFDLKFNDDEILKLPVHLKVFMCKYGWTGTKSNLHCLASDHGKFFNHSTDPNTLSKYVDDEVEVVTYAIRDINIGEEITDNYASFDENIDSLLNKLSLELNLIDDLDPRLK